MSDTAETLQKIRDQILSDPDAILEDRDVMRALVDANEKRLGNNIVDLRGVAMDRLEQRFDRLEDTHRNVIAAAYENLAGTNQIQRAVLALLEPHDFGEFLKNLSNEVKEILGVDEIKLCLETPSDSPEEFAPLNGEYSDILSFLTPGSIENYLTDGRNMSARAVTLRQILPGGSVIYSKSATMIRSESLLRLDLGAGNLPGLLALASNDADKFQPNQGSDLLAYFGGVFERIMRRWLG